MTELADNTVRCAITSPPYFDYKDYGSPDEIGVKGQSYKEYISHLKQVWQECLRVLTPNGKLCINVTNMKSRTQETKESFLYPILYDITKSCIDLGYFFSDEIIWVKGSANIGALSGRPLFGSYPYPPNFKILDSIQETILILRKPGPPPKLDAEIKEASRLSKKEWRKYTLGVWRIEPEPQNTGHCAVFPVELPIRLIKLYSYVNDLILDPFLGSGTTLLACRRTKRRGVGYEINESYRPVIEKKCLLGVDRIDEW